MSRQLKSPPRWPLRLLERLCNSRQLEVIYGDVEEVYFQRLRRSGRALATLYFYRDTFSMLRPFILKRAHEYHPRLNMLQMLSVYLKTGFRSLRKNAISSSINFFGLLMAMTAILMIAHYAWFELHYDRFHPDFENTYRIAYERKVNNETVFHGATTYMPVGVGLKEQFPEVKEQVRFYYPFTHAAIRHRDQAFVEEKPTFADASYFKVFGFQLLEGNPSTALSGPDKVLLTGRLAERYFGTRNALGKDIEFTFEDGSTTLEVTGILADPRADSHLQLDMLISFATLDQWPTFKESEWSLPFYHTYIQTAPGFDREVLQEKAASLISEKARGNDERNIFESVTLQPLKNIHLDSHLTFELGENGNRQAVYWLMAVAALILVIAYLNFVNLATALAMKRAKEVGVRKVMGATRKQLVYQFLTESLLLNSGALIASVILTFVLLPSVAGIMGIGLEFITNTAFWLMAVLVVLGGALVSGLYPAFVLSGYKAVLVLKGRFSHSSKGTALRKGLVSVQFVISIVMIGATLLLFEQTNYLMKKDPGFEAGKILVVSAPRNIPDPMQYQAGVSNFANILQSIPTVNSFTHSGSVPGKVMGSGSFRLAGNAEAEAIALQLNSVDHDFFKTYQLGFVAGRPFSRSVQTDRQSVIINTAAMDALGITDPEQALTSKIEARGREFGILGVIENYHHSSMKTQFEPIIFIFNPARTIYFSINLEPQNLPKTLKDVEKAMKGQFPGSPFDYFFLSDSLTAQFEEDLKLSYMFRVFSFLAVVLGALGLLGLTSFIVNQRVKEIGIRTVLGASGMNILSTLSTSFSWPLVISAVVSVLTLYLGGQQWLQGFPFRIGLDWMIFVVPLVIILSITFGIIGYQTSRILRRDPVNALKSE